MIQGALLWQQEGLVPPDAINQAVADYREEEDTLGDFLGACVKEFLGADITHGALFKAYQAFCTENGIRYALTSRVLAKKLKERGWRDGFDSRKQKLWRGVSLTNAG